MYTTEYGSCKRKTKFPDEASAFLIAQQLRPQMKKKKLLNVYKCKYCDGYHLTNMEQRKKKC